MSWDTFFVVAGLGGVDKWETCVRGIGENAIGEIVTERARRSFNIGETDVGRGDESGTGGGVGGKAEGERQREDGEEQNGRRDFMRSHDDCFAESVDDVKNRTR